MKASKTLNLSLSAALLVGMLGLTGCGRNQTYSPQGVKNQTAHRLNVDAHDQARDNLTNLKYSKTLSQKVTELGSVRSAHVMTSGNQAFVAINMNGTNPAAGKNRTHAMGMTSAGNVINGSPSVNRPKAQSVHPGGNDSRSNGAGSIRGLDYTGGISGGTNKSPHAGSTPNPGTIYDGSRLNSLSSTPTNNGMGGSQTSTISASTRQEIEQTIKRSAPHIQQVFISNDSDFVNRMNNFSVDDMTIGNNPLTNGARNATQDLGDMLNRLFPERLRNMMNTNPLNSNPNR